MDALAMGDYGAYVWSCYALAAIVVIVSDLRARARQKRVYKDIEVRIKALEDQ